MAWHDQYPGRQVGTQGLWPTASPPTCAPACASSPRPSACALNSPARPWRLLVGRPRMGCWVRLFGRVRLRGCIRWIRPPSWSRRWTAFWCAGVMTLRVGSGLGGLSSRLRCGRWTASHSKPLVVLCRIAQIGVIQLDTTPTERILYSLCRAESGVRPCTEIGANGQPDKALLAEWTVLS